MDIMLLGNQQSMDLPAPMSWSLYDENSSLNDYQKWRLGWSRGLFYFMLKFYDLDITYFAYIEELFITILSFNAGVYRFLGLIAL